MYICGTWNLYSNHFKLEQKKVYELLLPILDILLLHQQEFHGNISAEVNETHKPQLWLEKTYSLLSSASHSHELSSCLQLLMNSSQLLQCRWECREWGNGEPEAEKKRNYGRGGQTTVGKQFPSHSDITYIFRYFWTLSITSTGSANVNSL